MLVTLAGCGRGFMQYVGEREPWRREAEVACLNSGTVKESAGIVKISPIEGPGMCGADFPLKVSALGEGSALGYVDEPVRPPGSIAGGSRPAPEPRWPISQQQQYSAPQPQYAQPRRRSRCADVDRSARRRAAAALSAAAVCLVRRHPICRRRRTGSAATASRLTTAAIRRSPQRGAASSKRMTWKNCRPMRGPDAAPSGPPQSARPLPPLGPPRNPQPAAATPIEVKPTATLACPIVSALDRWFANAVQPAARKWFNQPVVEIKQISAYSCRGMNGQAGAKISEHAFGNALDIAAFVLADGHRITVKGGWKGSPEEQGFLRDVQALGLRSVHHRAGAGLQPIPLRPHPRRPDAAGERPAHLPAGRGGRRSGGVACSRESAIRIDRPIEPPPTRRYDPPVEPDSDPFAWRGDARRGDPATTGSIAARRPGIKDPAAEDLDWVEEPGPRPAIDWSQNKHKVY